MTGLGASRIVVRFGALLLLLGVLALDTSAKTATLRLPTPPDDAVPFTPGPDGRVTILLDVPSLPADQSATLTTEPFWDKDGKSYAVSLLGADGSGDGTTVTVRSGQPFILEAKDIPAGRVVWGRLTATYSDKPQPFMVALGHFGPRLAETGTISVDPDGLGTIRIDIGRHRRFGSPLQFTLAPFSSRGITADVQFVDPARNGNLTKTMSIDLPPTDDILALAINAGGLRPGQDYAGALRMSIGEHTFMDTALVLTKQAWDTAGVEFAKIEDAEGTSVAALTVGTAKAKPIRNFYVESVSGTTDAFRPKNNIKVMLGEVELWPRDCRDRAKADQYIIRPGAAKEIRVEVLGELNPGTYDAIVRFAAANVPSNGWAEGKVTFKKNRGWYIPTSVLFVSVLFSFASTKGVSTLLRRRGLRQRIKKIRGTSWLRDDRWGALPIVRAFGRAAMADEALKRLHGYRVLSRFFTAPDMITNELTEVESRLPVLERLNRLAIYWHATPSAKGVTANDVDPMIIRRAQKLLREIVDGFGQLQEGAEIDAKLLKQIEALEAWQEREHLESGYWASLRRDALFLLDSVQLDEFAFDTATRDGLRQRLQALLANPLDATQEKHLTAALAACAASDRNGVTAIRDALAPIMDQLADSAAIDADLRTLETCEREIVRALTRTADPATKPDTLHDMIRMERDYARLKLIWEQHNNDDWRRRLIDYFRNGTSLDEIFKAIDNEMWDRLQQGSVVRIKSPENNTKVEQYALTNFEVECSDEQANTFLFKHGLEYRWKITWGNNKLTPITRSTLVTQFIPDANARITAEVTMFHGTKSHPVDPVTFETVATSRFVHLWPTATPEWLGVFLATVLAFVAGYQSDAYAAAISGPCENLLELFAWGIAADQTKNLLQNLNKFTKGEGDG